MLGLLTSLLAGCQGAVDSNESVKIGVIMPMSGPVARLGEETKAMHDAILAKYFNDVDIEMVYADGKCNGSDAVTSYQKLVSIDNVDAILGGVCSTESLAISPLLEADNMIAVSGVSTSSDLQSASMNFYSFANSSYLPSKMMVEQASKFERVAMISEQVDYTMGVHDYIKNGLGDTLVSSEVYEAGSTDMRNVIIKALNSKPDALILNPNAGVTPKVLLNQLAENASDLDGVQIITQLAYLGAETRSDVAELAEGMMIVDVPEVVSLDFAEFKNSIDTEFQMHSDFLIASTHDAMLNLLTATIQAKQQNSDVLSTFRNLDLQGFISEGKTFDGETFLKGLDAGVFVIENEKPVLQ